MTIDNSELIAPFMPEADDGDTFLYTELLDRRQKTGTSNRARLTRTFFHRSRAEFLEQMPRIRHTCEMLGVRAYTRLSPRSFKKVGRLCIEMSLQHAFEGNWRSMRHAYASACGRVVPNVKLWLYDVDEPGEDAERLRAALEKHQFLVAVIPSRKGQHLIARPHDTRDVGDLCYASLHKDNPTNLYIHETAA